MEISTAKGGIGDMNCWRMCYQL